MFLILEKLSYIYITRFILHRAYYQSQRVIYSKLGGFLICLFDFCKESILLDEQGSVFTCDVT